MCDHFHPELNERIATLIYGYPADLAGDVDFPMPDYSMDNNAAAKLLEHVETKRRSLLPDVNRHLQHILDEQPGPLTLTDQLRLIDPYEICVAVLGALDHAKNQKQSLVASGSTPVEISSKKSA